MLAVGLVAYFLDWHVVHRTNALEGLSFYGHADIPPPLHDTGVAWTCTGFSHYQSSFILTALLAVWLSLALLMRPRSGVLVLLVQVALGAVTLAYAFTAQLLAHWFERVETRLAEPLFFLTLLAALVLTLLRAGYGILAPVQPTGS